MNSCDSQIFVFSNYFYKSLRCWICGCDREHSISIFSNIQMLGLSYHMLLGERGIFAASDHPLRKQISFQFMNWSRKVGHFFAHSYSPIDVGFCHSQSLVMA